MLRGGICDRRAEPLTDIREIRSRLCGSLVARQGTAAFVKRLTDVRGLLSVNCGGGATQVGDSAGFPVVSALSGLPRQTLSTFTNSPRERCCAKAQIRSRLTSLRESLPFPFPISWTTRISRYAMRRRLCSRVTGPSMAWPRGSCRCFELPRRQKWTETLANRVVARFGLHPLKPRHAVLCGFLAAEPGFCRSVARLRSQIQRQEPAEQFQSNSLTNVLGLPRPEMAPAPAIAGTDRLPALVTSGDLADWLGISLEKLDWFAGRRGCGRWSGRASCSTTATNGLRSRVDENDWWSLPNRDSKRFNVRS